MGNWSEIEISRTIEEIKRRCLIDPEFRALALKDPLSAIAKVNPKPVPEALTIRFIESSGSVPASVTDTVQTILLPDPLARIAELSDADLDALAGGDGAPPPKLRTS